MSMISRKTKNKDQQQSHMNTAFDMDLDLIYPSAERCEQVYRSYLEARNQAERGSAATGYQVYHHYFDTGFTAGAITTIQQTRRTPQRRLYGAWEP